MYLTGNPDVFARSSTTALVSSLELLSITINSQRKSAGTDIAARLFKASFKRLARLYVQIVTLIIVSQTSKKPVVRECDTYTAPAVRLSSVRTTTPCIATRGPEIPPTSEVEGR